MSRFISIAAVLLLCISQSALAEGSGVYVGAGVASGDLSACMRTAAGDCSTFSAGSKNQANLRLIGGYDFNKYFGIEAGVSQLGTYKVKNTILTTVGSVQVSAITLAARGGYVFHNGFSIFGKIGLADIKTQYTADPGWALIGNPNQTSTGLVMGIGGQYNFNDMLGLRLSKETIVFRDNLYVGAVLGTTLTAILKF